MEHFQRRSHRQLFRRQRSARMAALPISGMQKDQLEILPDDPRLTGKLNVVPSFISPDDEIDIAEIPRMVPFLTPEIGQKALDLYNRLNSSNS